MEWPGKEKGSDDAGDGSTGDSEGARAGGRRPNGPQKRRAPRRVTHDYLDRAAL